MQENENLDESSENLDDGLEPWERVANEKIDDLFGGYREKRGSSCLKDYKCVIPRYGKDLEVNAQSPDVSDAFEDTVNAPGLEGISNPELRGERE